MFKKGKTLQQKTLFDADQSFSPVVKAMLQNSWAGTFFEHVFLAIREERFAVLYSEQTSRPNAPVNLLISLLTLKELNGLTDEELIESLVFDYRFHYALGISNIEKERICINTLTHFRKRLFEHDARTGQDLLREEIEYLSNRLADISQLDYSMARMDSMMISSNCKQLSRLELVFTVIRNMVQEMDRQKIEIPEPFRPYLLSTHKKTVLYQVRQDETLTRTDELFQQAIHLYERISSISSLHSTECDL